MKIYATHDQKNCSLSSQDSGRMELKLSKFAMKSIECSRIIQNSIVMEWMQFAAPRRARSLRRERENVWKDICSWFLSL